jgi:diketogulonate reductase-like aldo/keto reductase
MRTDSIRTVALPSGDTMPVLGQGTRGFGEDPARRGDEIAALRSGIELGMTLVDTAESFSDGAAEVLVGQAIADHRDEVFLVSKVASWNATLSGTIAACERSLSRLQTDRLDLYLVQGPTDVPFEVFVDAFETLRSSGKIRHWGVCDFDAEDMSELTGPAGGNSVEANQVLYNLDHRGVEWDLVDWLQAARIPLLAYSPLDQGRLLRHPVLQAMAQRLGVAPAALALAWLLRRSELATTPRAGQPQHARENQSANGVQLDEVDVVALDDAFPPPVGPLDLETYDLGPEPRRQ